MTAAYRSSLATHFYYSSATATLAKPSGVVEGDVLVAVFCNNDSSRSISTYTGWTLAVNNGQAAPTSSEYWVLWKKAGASEPASYDFVFSDTFNGVGNIVAIQDGNTVNVVQGSEWSSVDTASPYTGTSPTATTTEDDCLLLAITFTRTTSVSAVTFAAPSGYTSRVEAKSASDNRMFAVSTKTLTTAGASGTADGVFTASGGGDARTAGVHLAISPAISSYVARPDADVSAGTWTASTGSDLYAMIDEETASDTDYVTATSAGTCEVSLSNIVSPPSGWQTTVSYRIMGAVTVSLRQGASTEIASWPHTASPPGSPTTYAQTLSSGEQASISDWTDLRLRFVKP